MKKLIAVFFVLFAVVCMCFAVDFNYTPAIDVMMGGTFLHGTSKYLNTIQGKDAPFFRTSYSMGADFFPAGFSFSRFGVGTGLSIQHTSQSLKAGNSVLQEYSGLGLALSGSYFFSDSFYLSLKTRLMFNKNVMKYQFATFDVELTPEFKIKDVKSFRVSFVTPVIFTYRNDSLSVRLNLGIRLGLTVGSRDWAVKKNAERKEKNSVFDPYLSGSAPASTDKKGGALL